MIISLIFRSKERNEYSIEALFASLKSYINTEYSSVDYYLPYGRYNRIRYLIGNYKVAKKIKSDVYHITGEVNFVATAFPGDKTLITVHDYVDIDGMRGIKRLIRWLFWCYIPYKHCRHIVCVSKNTLNETVKRFPFSKEKAVYIPNPIDDTFKRVEKKFNAICPRILLMGTRENKNVERIIEAVKGINCELFIVGVLSDKQKQKLTEANIKYDNVYHITNQEIKIAYIDSDILCFPSTYEGFGRPIIEANAIGRVVITSNIAPMIEVANGSAILVDPFDSNSIREGILSAIEDKKNREQLIDRGYVNADLYRAERIAHSYMELYRKYV